MPDQTTGKLWHLAKGGQKLGEFTSQQLADKGTAGEITSDMVVWREGMAGWQPVAKVKGLTVIQAAPTPPPAPSPPAITVAVAPAPAAAPMPVRGHVTIEKTGKSLKLQYALAVCTIIAGSITSCNGMGSTERGEASTLLQAGSGAVIFGFIWLFITKAKMWWHHG